MSVGCGPATSLNAVIIQCNEAGTCCIAELDLRGCKGDARIHSGRPQGSDGIADARSDHAAHERVTAIIICAAT